MSEEEPPVELHDDERTLREGRARHPRSTVARIGFNPVNGYLWLTNQRVIFQMWRHANPRITRVGPNVVVYPLGRVIDTSVVTVRVDIAGYTLVRLDFDDGGREYFEFTDDPAAPLAWQRAIDLARAGAPALAYETAPAQHASIEGAGGRTWRFLGLLVLGIIGACLVTCLVLALIGEFLPAA